MSESPRAKALDVELARRLRMRGNAKIAAWQAGILNGHARSLEVFVI